MRVRVRGLAGPRTCASSSGGTSPASELVGASSSSITIRSTTVRPTTRSPARPALAIVLVSARVSKPPSTPTLSPSSSSQAPPRPYGKPCGEPCGEFVEVGDPAALEAAAPVEAVAVAAERLALDEAAPDVPVAGNVKLPEMGDGASGSWCLGDATEFAMLEAEAEADSRGLNLQGAWPPRALPEEKTMPHHLHVWSGNVPPSPTRARCCCCGWVVPVAGAPWGLCLHGPWPERAFAEAKARPHQRQFHVRATATPTAAADDADAADAAVVVAVTVAGALSALASATALAVVEVTEVRLVGR